MRQDGSADREAAPGVTLKADVILKRRRDLGLTQEALGTLAGLTDRTVRAAETRRPVSMATARLLSAALEVPLPALVWRSSAEVQRQLASAGYAPGTPPKPWGARPVEVQRIVDALADASHGAVCIVSGPTGIGKTALACFAARALADRFPDGVAWVHAGGANLEGPLAWQLQLAAAFYFQASLPPPGLVGREAFNQAFRRSLWTGRRLLVLDDVARTADLACFVGPGDAARVLVTTMHRAVAEMPGHVVVPVGPLDEDVGVALLGDHLGRARVQAEPAAARRMVRLLGGVPRSLQIAGRVLKRERYTLLEDYAGRLEASPREPVDPLADAITDHDASFTTVYAQLRASLSAGVWPVFGALSAFGPRSFSAAWAAAVADVPASDVRRSLGELAEFYLLAEVESPAEASAAAGPRFVLDAQSQRAARWIAGAGAREAEDRLVDHAVRLGEALDAQPAAACLQSFTRDAELWRHSLDLATRRVLAVRAATTAGAPSAIPTIAPGTAHEAVRLCRLLVALRKALYLTMPPGTGEWLTAGLAAAAAIDDEGAFGQLCRLMGRWTGLTAPDVRQMTAWYEAAVPALLAGGRVDDAIDAMAYAAKAVTMVHGPEVGLPKLEQTVAAAEAQGASAATRASVLNSTACVDCVVGGAGSLARAEAHLRAALALEVSGWTGSIAHHIAQLNLATVARLARPDAAPNVGQDVGPHVAAVRALLPDDPLSHFLLDATARFISPKAQAPAAVDDRFRRLALLAVPQELAFRRTIQSFQIGLELPHYFAPVEPSAPASRPRLAKPIGITPILIGLPIEVDLPLPGLLYPVAPLLDLLADGGLGYLSAFVAQLIGPDNPRLALLRQLEPFFQ